MGLGARLALVFAVVAAATALVVGGASYATANRQVTAEIDQFLRQRAAEISQGQRDRPKDRRDGRPEAQVIVAVGADAEVQILDDQGDVVSNTGLLLPVTARDRELATRFRPVILRTIAMDDSDYRVITEHLPGGGAVQVARSLDESAQLLTVLQTQIPLVAGLVALTAACAGWVVAQRTTRPLRALTKAVDEVAETRDFTVPVPSVGRDEVGRLGRGFTRMLGALEVSQQQQHRLVQDAAHELRTPLTSVTANIEWLMRAHDVDLETRNTTLASIRRELSELNDVMSEVIELATDSHQPSALIPTDLGAVVDGVVAQFISRSGRNVTITGDATTTIDGDADALARAISNLLLNADKYSPPDAPIGVQAIGTTVFVDDAGEGIPADERALVFDRFYRRDEDRPMPGSGLGLSIVASIVERHGGSVYAGESPLGGARVGFTLPSVDAPLATR